jgi:hypothetical protein
MNLVQPTCANNCTSFSINSPSSEGRAGVGTRNFFVGEGFVGQLEIVGFEEFVVELLDGNELEKGCREEVRKIIDSLFVIAGKLGLILSPNSQFIG